MSVPKTINSIIQKPHEKKQSPCDILNRPILCGQYKKEPLVGKIEL